MEVLVDTLYSIVDSLLNNFYGGIIMKQYFINGFEVHENTYKQYLDKEFKRVKKCL